MDLKCLSFKTAFLLVIALAKLVSEIHALSISHECLKWNPELNHTGYYQPFSLAAFEILYGRAAEESLKPIVIIHLIHPPS